MRTKLTIKNPRPASPSRAPVRSGSLAGRKPTRPAPLDPATKPKPSAKRPAGAKSAAPRAAKPAGAGAVKPRAPRDGERGGFGRPPREGGDRPARDGARFSRDGDRPARPARDGERGAFRGEGRPARTGGDRPPRDGTRFSRDGDRPARPARDGERPTRDGARFSRDGDRPARPARDGERGSFRGEGRPTREGERPPRDGARFSRDGDRPARPARDGEHGSFRGEGRPARDGERPPRDGARFSRDGDRPARPARDGERGSFRGEGRPTRDGERPPRDGARFSRDGDRPARPARDGERSAFRGEGRPARDSGDRPARAGARPVRDAAPSRLKVAQPVKSRAASFDDADETGMVRLSKRMSELGLCSRREADEWIEKGWVLVDGERIDTLGTKVRPEQNIEIDQRAQAAQAAQVTILLHKPVGYVSGQAEDGYEPAVTLITRENHWSGDHSALRFSPQHLRTLAPAGRLDIDSTGLLVLTQDGRIAKQLIGEQSDIDKEYLVRVRFGERLADIDQHFPAESLAKLRHGLELDGAPLKPAMVSWQNGEQLRFVLREGKKRQIRRMCELVGLEVIGLKRVRMGHVMLGALPQGEWRYLSPDENF
ncbi:pseudouridine synthase [Burkholderia gladioli pv. gladioli]|uniref:pseudouridine synthase n=1 Tax=Burkholderia gladioli TaxID=28095 RepID=UPI0024BD13BE|nr:pseudouridine synthase [Burkholderia gladioli]MDJ1163977.1 pseudouridine synthase [Burkholderia gladioli pv. gladioli]